MNNIGNENSFCFVTYKALSPTADYFWTDIAVAIGPAPRSNRLLLPHNIDLKYLCKVTWAFIQVKIRCWNRTQTWDVTERPSRFFVTDVFTVKFASMNGISGVEILPKNESALKALQQAKFSGFTFKSRPIVFAWVCWIVLKWSPHWCVDSGLTVSSSHYKSAGVPLLKVK